MNESITRSQALEVALAKAIESGLVSHADLETLDIEDLYVLIQTNPRDSLAMAPLRKYLETLPGFLESHQAGQSLSSDAIECHRYACMLMFERKSQEAVTSKGDRTVVSSILPTDL